jgi:hypothetical protein
MEQATSIGGGVSGQIGRYESFENGKDEEDVHYTNLAILITTNYRPTSRHDYYLTAQKLFDTLKVVFNKDKMDEHFIEFGKNDATFKDDEWKAPTIISAKSFIGVELGRTRRGGRVHAHVVVEIAHRSNIWGDPLKVKEYVDSQMAPKVKGSKVLIKRIPSTMNHMLSYAQKEKAISPDELADIVAKLVV